MKFRIPNPPDIKAARQRRKTRIADEAKAKLEAHIEKSTVWHEAFSWLPTKLTNEDPFGSHWAWFEKITQKASVKNIKKTHWFTMNDKTIAEYTWTRHTSKEYFKKILNGEIEPVKVELVNLSHDGTNFTMNVRDVADDITLYDENGSKVTTMKTAMYVQRDDDGTIKKIEYEYSNEI